MSEDVKKLVLQYIDKVIVAIAALIFLWTILGLFFGKGDLKKIADEIEKSAETIRTNLMTSQPPKASNVEELAKAKAIKECFSPKPRNKEFIKKFLVLREGVFHPPLPGFKRVWVKVNSEVEVDFDGRVIVTDPSSFSEISDKVSVIVWQERKSLKITGRSKGTVDIEVKTKREETGEEKNFLVRVHVTEQPPPRSLYPPVNVVAVADRATFSAILFWNIDQRQSRSAIRQPDKFIIERKNVSKSSPKFKVIATVDPDKVLNKEVAQPQRGTGNAGQQINMQGQMMGGAMQGGMMGGGMEGMMGMQGDMMGEGMMGMQGGMMGEGMMGMQGGMMGEGMMGMQGEMMGAQGQTGSPSTRTMPKGRYKYTDKNVEPGETYVYRIYAFAKKAIPRKSDPSEEAVDFFSKPLKREITIPTDIKWYVKGGSDQMATIRVKKWFSDSDLDLETWIYQNFPTYRGEKIGKKKGVVIKDENGDFVMDENNRPVRKSIDFSTGCTLVDVIPNIKMSPRDTKQYAKVVFEDSKGVLREKWSNEIDFDELMRKRAKKARRKSKRGNEQMEGMGGMMGAGAAGAMGDMMEMQGGGRKRRGRR